MAGPDAMTELARVPCDVVLNGVVGSLGLAPTLAALESGRVLALANKESLVAGGPLVRAPVSRSFGSRLLEEAIPRQLGGFGLLSFPATGLEYCLTVPLEKLKPADVA